METSRSKRKFVQKPEGSERIMMFNLNRAFSFIAAEHMKLKPDNWTKPICHTVRQEPNQNFDLRFRFG